MSQALYPTEGDHSLIVWVDIEWWNGTASPGVRDSWAWSTSCLYVVLPLELFPLLSIWVFNPQQRMKEVCAFLPQCPATPTGLTSGLRWQVSVSLPPFCANVTTEQANSALYLGIKRVRLSSSSEFAVSARGVTDYHWRRWRHTCAIETTRILTLAAQDA
jgi:hypothetical protein